MDPLCILRSALPLVEPYPAGIVPVPERIPGTAYYPAGDGLWKERGDVAFPTGGVMVLAPNIDSEKGYRHALKKGKENLQRVLWGRMIMLLEGTGIDPRMVFFTSLFVGMKAQAPRSGLGSRVPEDDYVKRCQRYFLLQVSIMQPRMLITLGLELPRLIASLTPDLHPWKDLRSIEDLDNSPMNGGVTFPGSAKKCMVVGLIHPTLVERNLEQRMYNGYQGQYVEEMILGNAASEMLYTDDNESLEWCKPPLHWYRQDQPKLE